MDTEKENVDINENLLQYTEEKRKRIIEALFKNGPPEDTKEAYVAIAALDGLDKQALSRMKIKSKESIAEYNDIKAAEAADKIIKSGVFAALINQSASNNISTHVVPDGALPEPTCVEGELDIGVSTENYDEFVQRVMGQNE